MTTPWLVGLRGKLFLISLLLTALVLVLVETPLAWSLRVQLLEDEQRHLLEHARSGIEMLSLTRPAPLAAEVDPLADRLGQAVGNRVTIVDAEGRVVGDSFLTLAEVAQAENHRHRPEIEEALAGRLGESRRHSATVSHDMLYVAMPVEGVGWQGVIRVASSLEVVEKEVRRQRWMLLASGAATVVLALIVASLSSRWITRRLRRLVAIARRAVRERPLARTPTWEEDEIDGLTTSFHWLADDLEHTLATLARERNRMAAILEGMVEGVVVLDRELRVTVVNGAAQRLLRVSPQAEGGVLATLAETPLVEAAQLAMTRGREEQRHFAWAGEQVLVNAAPIALGEGCVLVLREITEAHRLEQMRRDFVANASHELRTPVGIILANTEILLDGALAEAAFSRSLVEAVERQGRRLANLISDLMDLSRLEGGAHVMVPEALELASLVAGLLTELTQGAAAQGITLVDRIPAATWVWADRLALERILVNLLSNGVAYVPAGGTVTVAAEAAGERVRVTVTDDGPGIAEEHHGRLFERFYRVDSGRARERGGTGLGLSLVKHLVENMGGQVGVASVQPQGACFWFTLPVCRAPAAA